MRCVGQRTTIRTIRCNRVTIGSAGVVLCVVCGVSLSVCGVSFSVCCVSLSVCGVSLSVCGVSLPAVGKISTQTQYKLHTL